MKLIILFLFSFYSVNLHARNYGEFNEVELAGKKEIIIASFSSPQGIELLDSAKYKNDFYSLASHFQPQINPLYCGIASSVIILNALNQGKFVIENSKNIITKPKIFGGGIIEFRTFTQDEFLSEYTDVIKPRKVIRLEAQDKNLARFDAGLTLQQLADMLNYYNVKTKIIYAEGAYDLGLAQFRKNLIKILEHPDSYIIANFQGKHIGALTAGHISPIVAYNETKDKILIMDVASHLQPWYWVNLEKFYQAMQIKDGNKARGYLIATNKLKN